MTHDLAAEFVATRVTRHISARSYPELLRARQEHCDSPCQLFDEAARQTQNFVSVGKLFAVQCALSGRASVSTIDPDFLWNASGRSAPFERSCFGPVSKMALMNKDDVKRAIVVISALSIMLFIALWLLIETGVILAEAP